MAQPPFFHVDHARRDIEALTVAVHGCVEDHGEASCIKTGWLNFPEPEPGPGLGLEQEHEPDQHRHQSEAEAEMEQDDDDEEEDEGEENESTWEDDDRSCIPAKHSTGAAEDIFPVLFSPGEGVVIHYDLWTAGHTPHSAIYPWKDDRAGRSKVAMPHAQNPAYELDIVGGTYFPLVLKEWHSWGFLKLNVKCLVTTSEPPFIQPDYSHVSHLNHRGRPLMWIGVGTETATKGKSGSLVQQAYRMGGMHQGSKPAYWVHKDDDGVEMI